MRTKMVCWPALLKLDGDDELIYLESELECVKETSEMILNDDDHIIDSDGNSFRLSFEEELNVRFLANTRSYSLDEVTRLIQEHEFNAAQVCITKTVFSTISEAVLALR